MRKRLVLLALVFVVLVFLLAGCGSDESADQGAGEGASQVSSGEDASSPGEAEEAGVDGTADREDGSREAEEQTQEHAADIPWVEPDPVPRTVEMLATGSGFDQADISGSVAARADRGDRSWVRVEIAHSDPSYEGELVYLEIAVGDEEWTVIDFGTGLTAADLEAQGVPADVAAIINPF